MEFYGLGNDIVEISRIEKAMSNEKFITRVFTENEIKLIESKGNRSESYAGRFAAKEAISKAMGTGVRGFNLYDIEILNDGFGKPIVFLKNEIGEKFRDYKIEISISHSRDFATAVAIILKI